MKLNYTLPVILVTVAIACYFVRADLEEKTKLFGDKTGDDRGKERVDPVIKISDAIARGQLDPKGEGNVGAKKVVLKENEGVISKSKMEPKEGELSSVKDRCDFSSNRCMDDDKTFAACLRVPGKSLALSLLIENKGKATLRIIISAPDLVKLEKEKIELQGNKDAEIKVSIEGVKKDHFIVLTAGHGNCSLDFRNQFLGRKEVDQPTDSSYFSTFRLSFSTGFLLSAALLIGVVSAFMCVKLGAKYFAKKGPKYQKMDMELPVSHGSKHESGENEGWDDSWGDNWDDEEAPTTPSMPLTPSLSSKGMASRKHKDGWKD